jgi:hypothetical protein
VFTLEVAVACMSRFTDQFVLLFDASKPWILLNLGTHTKYHFFFGRICPEKKRKIQRDAAVALEICLAGAWHSLQSERSAVPVPPPPVRRAHVAGSVMGGDGSLFSRPLRTLSPALSVPVGSGRVAMPLPLSCVAWLGLKVVVTVHARPPLLGARSAAFPPVQFEWN